MASKAITGELTKLKTYPTVTRKKRLQIANRLKAIFNGYVKNTVSKFQRAKRYLLPCLGLVVFGGCSLINLRPIWIDGSYQEGQGCQLSSGKAHSNGGRGTGFFGERSANPSYENMGFIQCTFLMDNPVSMEKADPGDSSLMYISFNNAPPKTDADRAILITRFAGPKAGRPASQAKHEPFSIITLTRGPFDTSFFEYRAKKGWIKAIVTGDRVVAAKFHLYLVRISKPL